MSRPASQSPEARFTASVGAHLTRLIDRSGAPVRDVSDASGIHERRLRLVLTGAAEHVHVHELVRLCEAVGVKASTFMESARL